MPRSECMNCRSIFVSDSQDELKVWEKDHHEKSWSPSQPNSIAKATGLAGTHSCQGFLIYNNLEIDMGHRSYNHGHMVDEKIYT